MIFTHCQWGVTHGQRPSGVSAHAHNVSNVICMARSSDRGSEASKAVWRKSIKHREWELCEMVSLFYALHLHKFIACDGFDRQQNSYGAPGDPNITGSYTEVDSFPDGYE